MVIGTGVIVLALIGAWLTARVLARRGRRLAVADTASNRDDLVAITAADLGAPIGPVATLVHFSTAFCQPCRATRRVLSEVAAMLDGVAHIEIDAEARLDLVRRLGVVRTPTVLVLDPAGKVIRRASGQPHKRDVIAAIGAVSAGTDRSDGRTGA